MTDSKSGTAATTKTEAEANPAEAKAREEQSQRTSESTQRYILIGQLRRDTMILNHGTDLQELKANALDAVREGRAAIAFVIPAEGFVSESEIDFDITQAARGREQYFDQGSARVPLLNPSTGVQSTDVAADSEPEPPVAPVPTHGAVQAGDDNKGAGTGTGNTDKVADAKADKK